MKNLRWFHAFNRPKPIDIVGVLRNGPTPAPPTVKSSTKDNELTLGLDHSVYAYLGRSTDLFGQSGFVFPQSKAPKGGHLCPFDTGGLVARICPVNSWTPQEKSALSPIPKIRVASGEDRRAAPVKFTVDWAVSRRAS